MSSFIENSMEAIRSSLIDCPTNGCRQDEIEFLGNHHVLKSELFKPQIIPIKSIGLINMIQNNQHFVINISRSLLHMLFEEIRYYGLKEMGICLEMYSGSLTIQRDCDRYNFSKITDHILSIKYEYEQVRDSNHSSTKMIFGSMGSSLSGHVGERELIKSIMRKDNVFIFLFDTSIGNNSAKIEKDRMNISLINEVRDEMKSIRDVHPGLNHVMNYEPAFDPDYFYRTLSRDNNWSQR